MRSAVDFDASRQDSAASTLAVGRKADDLSPSTHDHRAPRDDPTASVHDGGMLHRPQEPNRQAQYEWAGQPAAVEYSLYAAMTLSSYAVL